MHVGVAQLARQRAAAGAGQRQHAQLALVRGLHRAQQAGALPVGGQHQQQIARAAQGPHLRGQRVRRVAAAHDGGQRHRVGPQGQRRQLGARAAKAAHQQRRHILGQRHRRAFAAGQHLAAAGDARQQGLRGLRNGPRQHLGPLIAQVGAVDEPLLDVLLMH